LAVRRAWCVSNRKRLARQEQSCKREKEATIGKCARIFDWETAVPQLLLLLLLLVQRQQQQQQQEQEQIVCC
jgi:hypothetical protein